MVAMIAGALGAPSHMDADEYRKPIHRIQYSTGSGNQSSSQSDALNPVLNFPSTNAEPWKHGILGAPQKEQKVDTPRILTIDYKQLIDRYDNPNLIGEAAQKAHKEFSKTVWPLLQQLVAENGGNLLLDRRIFLTDTTSTDISDLAFERLDAAYPPANIPQPPTGSPRRPIAAQPLMLVADLKKLREAAKAVYGTQTDPLIAEALYAVMQSRHASLVVDREVVVSGLIDIDVTKDALSRLAGDQSQAESNDLTPQLSVVVSIDRSAILKSSRAGNFVVRRIMAMTAEAEAEFKLQGDHLRQEGNQLMQKVRHIRHMSVEVELEIHGFELQQKAFEKEVSQRQTELQNGALMARYQIEKTLEPIVVKIQRDHGANVLIDRNAVVVGTADIDVTAEAIDALDAALQEPKVERLKDPPPPL
ncbi:MAG: OmpH family outer membrane protein [Proteobacteria bacterium]|nr:OmpH family outer membrane protein [Pseudomonadota bacterium]